MGTANEEVIRRNQAETDRVRDETIFAPRQDLQDRYGTNYGSCVMCGKDVKLTNLRAHMNLLHEGWDE